MSTESSGRTFSYEDFDRLQKRVAALEATLEEERRQHAVEVDELQRTLSLVESVVDQCPIPMVVATAIDASIRLVNRAAVEALGLAVEPEGITARFAEALAKPTWRALGPDGTLRDSSGLPLGRAVRGEVIHNEETLFVRHNGTERWHSVSASQVVGLSGHGVAGLVVFPDITERRLSEMARDAAERLARQHAEEMSLLLKSMHSAFVVWRTVLDADGHLKDFYFEYFNDAYERVSGVKLADVQGKSVREVWPTTEQSWYEVYGEIARTGVAASFEMYHEPTHGLYACNAYQPPNLRDRICVVFEDVTEHKATLEQLQSMASQQQALLNTVPVGISLLKERRLQWVNPAFVRMFEYTLDELVGVPSSTLYLHQSDADRVGKEGYGVLSTGEAYTTEVLFKKKDGTPMWCHVTGQAIDRHDPSKGSLWTLHDITERRQAEEALRESERRFKHLVQQSSDVIMVTDGDFAITSVSESAVRTMGYRPAELLGKRCPELVHPEDVEAVRLVLAEMLRTPREPKRLEFRGQHKDGQWVPLEVVGTNLLSDPSVKGIVHNIRDISERTHMAEQLQQAMKMEAVGRLAGGVAHDFNNLLTVISGSLELAMAELRSESDTATLLAEAANAARSATALTRQLLAFSRRQLIEPKVVNLNHLVEELRKLLARVIGEDIVLQTLLARDLGAVRVDVGQFEQVLVNLVVNARDAMPKGGRLILETANVELDADYARLHLEVVPGPHVLLAVSDTGEGMTEQVKQRLFEPFFTTKPKGRGTGLGLATIFGAIKQSGGSIEVYSELGTGTTFKVYLPMVEARPQRLSRSETALVIPTGKETVLLVEDDDSVRKVAQTILQRLGYVVLTASNGAEALLLARTYRGPLNLLMTDVVMPGMNGRELADQLAITHPEMHILFTSGYTEDVIVHHGVVDENTSFIGKPYSVQALAEKLRQILD